MSTQMTIELSTEKPRRNGFYNAYLDLPATDMEIEDAVRRARFHNESAKRYLTIEESALFDGTDLAIGADSLRELNYLAQRLDSLSDEDIAKFEAVYSASTRAFPREADMSVRSVVNMTYGLDAVPIAVNVTNALRISPMRSWTTLITRQSEKNSVSRTAASSLENFMFPHDTMNRRTCMTVNIFLNLRPNRALCSAC